MKQSSKYKISGLVYVRRWLGLVCGTLAGVALAGCARLALVTVNVAADFSDYTRQTNLVYGTSAAAKLDLYLPVHRKHNPIVIFFYGSAWNGGDKASYKFVGAALADAGIIAVVPNYSLYPQAKFPTFMQDAAKAIAWTRSHAREWDGDPNQIYLVGHSAGAHIAVMLALDQEYLQQVGGTTNWLRGVVGLAGPYDFLPFTEEYLNDLFGPPENFSRSQPINYVRKDAPPLLLMHGLKDQRVSPRNTISLAAAMQAVGGRVNTRYFERAGHADLVAAFSIPQRNKLPVFKDIKSFIDSDGVLKVPSHN